MARVWLVRADGGQLAEEFRAGKHISIGWNLRDDLSGVTDRAELEAACRRAKPETSPSVVTRIVNQIDSFLNEIYPGDHILTPKLDHRWLMHGIVADGPAYFAPAHDDPHHHGNRRPVNWQTEDLYRYSCATEDQKALRDRATVVLVSDDSADFWSKVETGVEPEPPTKATGALPEKKRVILERIHSAFSWDEFQDLVAALLSAMGCEILHVAPPGPDSGVDIKAVTSDLLTPNIPLAVQVKHYKLGNNIGRKDVRELRSGVPFGGRGVFVTTSDFVGTATEVASEPGFPHIALINGSLLVDLLATHWQEMDLPQEFRDRLEGLLHDAGGQSSS